MLLYLTLRKTSNEVLHVFQPSSSKFVLIQIKECKLFNVVVCIYYSFSFDFFFDISRGILSVRSLERVLFWAFRSKIFLYLILEHKE